MMCIFQLIKHVAYGAVSFLLHSHFTMALMIIVLAVYLLVYVFLRLQSNSNIPPGPISLPIIGNLHQLGQNLHERLSEFAKRFGDIYTLQLGSRRAIVLNSAHLVKEALVKNARRFASRPPLPSFKMNDLNGRSITFGPNGSLYSKNHRLALLALHSFLSDQERFSQQLIKGAEEISLRFAQHNYEAFDPIGDIRHSIAEMNLGLVFGDDIDAKDKGYLEKLLNGANEFVQNDKITNVVDFIPILSYFVMGRITRLKEIVKELNDFVKEMYEKNKEKFIGKEKVDCVADALVKCYEKGTNERIVAVGEELDLDEENIVTVLTDLYGASVETTSTTLCWALLYLAMNTTVQERINKELINNVGNDNNISIRDKPMLPFLEATVLEILRLSTVLPLAIPHYVEDECFLGNYRIPADTMIILNLWKINHDERVFKDPFSFYPDRFLDQLGNVNKTRFSFLPFGIGARKCIGQNLAQVQLLIIIGSLVQKYKFEIDGDASYSPTFGFVLHPQPFKIKVTPRSGQIN